MDSDPVTETSKALKETAITAGKAVDLTQKFGRFFGKFVAGSLEQGFGMVEDQLRFARHKRQIRLMNRVEQLMTQFGEDVLIKPLELKLAIPLFQAASLEENDELQDKWAKLLVNSSVASCGIELRRSYIDILEQLSHLDAVILDKIYISPHDTNQRMYAVTGGLPDTVSFLDLDSSGDGELGKPNQEVVVSLANLARLGCIRLPTSWDGAEIFTSVYHTVMGRSLINACRLDG